LFTQCPVMFHLVYVALPACLPACLSVCLSVCLSALDGYFNQSPCM